MKKIIFMIIIITISTFFTFSKDFEVPKNVKIISQSCAMTSFFVSVIDLSNNEVIILEYSTKAGLMGKLINLIRTGMFVNPEKQSFLEGKDCPYESQKG